MDDTAYMQNLKKMIQMKLFQNRNRLTNLENIFTGVGERDWDFGMDISTLLY